jgi:hypothetical protein
MQVLESQNRKRMVQSCTLLACCECQVSMSEQREDPKIQFLQPCWQLAYSKTAGFDPTFNPRNRFWYWREGRSAFGRFVTDADGLFFMRGDSDKKPDNSRSQHAHIGDMPEYGAPRSRPDAQQV